MAVAEVVAGVACSSDLHPSSLSASPVLVPPPSLTDVLLGLAGPVPVQSKRVSQKVQACHSRARITISPAYRTNLASAQRVVPYGPWNSASNQCRNPAESPPHSWSAFRRFRPRPAPPATFGSDPTHSGPLSDAAGTPAVPRARSYRSRISGRRRGKSLLPRQGGRCFNGSTGP
jgi:hypothetical protein